MVSSVYNDLVQYQEVGGDLVARINAIGLNPIFVPIIEEYSEDKSVFNKVLFFLLHCYSRESDYHIQYKDWGFIKTQVAASVGIGTEDELFDQLFYLKNVKFTRTVRLYLDYQGGKAMKHLMMLKDLYEQMVNSAIENIQDKDGIIMYDQKVKNAEHADKIYNKIADWEQRIEKEESSLTQARLQLKEKEKAGDKKFSLRMEDNNDV